MIKEWILMVVVNIKNYGYELYYKRCVALGGGDT